MKERDDIYIYKCGEPIKIHWPSFSDFHFCLIFIFICTHAEVVIEILRDDDDTTNQSMAISNIYSLRICL